MRTQTSVDNTVNDLRYKIKFENYVKEKNNFIIKRNNVLFLETYFFKIPKNLITSAFFFAEPDTKKHGYASAKCCTGKTY